MEAELDVNEMPKKVLSGKLWPIHFTPQDDELLSSWIARLSSAHGSSVPYFLSAAIKNVLNPYDLQNTDIDKSARTELMVILAERTSTPMDKLVSATLLGYEGLLYEKRSRTGPTQWLLPFITQKNYGLQYCPYCLSEDKEPFFRRSWRLAFNSLCIKHHIQLLDRCTLCGNSINYYKGIKSTADTLPSGSITRCHSCHADLREIASRAIICDLSQHEIEFQKSLIEAIESRWIKISGDTSVYSLLFFKVLHRLTKILSHRSKGLDLRRRVSQASKIKMFAVSFPSKQCCFEELNVHARRRLLNMAGWMLTDWPERFIDFCKANRIRCGQLFGNSTDYPFWYWSVVRTHLDGTYYRPSAEEITSAVTCYNKLARKHYELPPESFTAIHAFLKKMQTPRRREVLISANLFQRSTRGSFKKMAKFHPGMPPRYLSDSQWAEIEPFIPHMRRESKTPDDRTILNGILYVLLGGCYWNRLPAKFGTYGTLYHKFQKWKKTGIFEQIWLRCSSLYDD